MYCLVQCSGVGHALLFCRLHCVGRQAQERKMESKEPCESDKTTKNPKKIRKSKYSIQPIYGRKFECVPGSIYQNGLRYSNFCLHINEKIVIKIKRGMKTAFSPKVNNWFNDLPCQIPISSWVDYMHLFVPWDNSFCLEPNILPAF